VADPAAGTAASTLVRVADLPVLADIGINPDEIGRRQPLIPTVELTLRAPNVRDLTDTVDYRQIVKAAEALATVHIPLIEMFAQRLGERCVQWPGVASATIRIDKPFAISPGLAGVQVTVTA
jgi:dihydroneopterin aldolase